MIGKNSHDYRPLGLGYANLGALLMAAGLPYDSDAGRDYAACVTAIMCGEAYLQSSRIAEHCEPLVPATEATRKNLSETNLGAGITNAHVGSNAHVGTDAFVRPAEQSEASAAHVGTTGHVETTGHVGTAAPGRPVEQSSTAHSHPAPNTQPRIHAMTDITGFGLIGHAREILLASDVSMKIEAGKIPILEGALACIQAGHIPGGLTNNRNFAECLVEYDEAVPEDLRTILYDPQTAGGLLIATPDAEAVVQALSASQVPAVIIGEVLPNSKPRIHITK